LTRYAIFSTFALLSLLLVTVHTFNPVRPPPLTTYASNPVVSILGESSSSPDIVDPGLLPGSILNITVQASNLPPVLNEISGGIQGFDITLDYNASILRPIFAGSITPFCTLDEGCIFANLTRTQVYNFADTTSTANGAIREGMIVYNQQNRASISGILFKVQFQVIGRGVSPIALDQNHSTLIGFSNGCGSSITNYTVTDAVFDNRQPWRVLASPASITLAPGGMGKVNVTVVRVNSDGNVTLIMPNAYTPVQNYPVFNPRTGILDIQSGKTNFTSTLTFNVTTTATPNSYSLPIIAHDSFIAGGFREYRLNYTLVVSSTAAPIASPASSDITGPIAINVVGTPVQTSIAYPSLPLVANFTFAQSPNETITYAAIVCGGTPPFSYHWDFGDGTTGTGGGVNHHYTPSSTYVVTLTVTDSNGISFSSTQHLVFNQPNPTTLGELLLPIGVTATILVASAIVFLSRGFLTRRSRKTRKRS